MKGEIIVDLKKIVYCKYLLPYSSTSVVIVHGLGGCKEKFKDIVQNFISKGFSVYILDLPGHGESDGYLANKDLYYVNKFDDYVFALKHFINDIVKRDSQNKIIVYGHSMGGLIVTLLLEENPNIANTLILSAPMFKIKQKMPDFIFRTLTCIFSKILPKKRVFMANGKKAPTWNWLQEAILAEKRALNKDNAIKIDVPILLLQAGKDLYVDNTASDTFSTYFKKIKKFVYSEANHNIFLEDDKIKQEYYNDIFKFIRSYGL